MFEEIDVSDEGLDRFRSRKRPVPGTAPVRVQPVVHIINRENHETGQISSQKCGFKKILWVPQSSDRRKKLYRGLFGKIFFHNFIYLSKSEINEKSLHFRKFFDLIRNLSFTKYFVDES